MDFSLPALPAAALPAAALPALPASAAALPASAAALPAPAADIPIVDVMDYLEISNKPDNVQIIRDIILEAVNNKYNWQDAKVLLSKFKKFAGNREMTLDDMRKIGIDAARSYSNFKHIKNIVSNNKPTDQYHTSKDWHNKTGIHLRIDQSGNVIIRVRLSNINQMILDIISCMGPIYLEITSNILSIIPDVMQLPVFSDNVISINIYGDSRRYINRQPDTMVVQKFPEFLRSFTSYITITNNFMNIIPTTVEYLQISNAIEYLDIYPMGLKTFIYSCNNYYPYYDNYKDCIYSFGILPYGMTKLSIDGLFAMPFSEVPQSVEFIYIHDLYETLINFPSGLKMLAIQNVFEPWFCPEKKCGAKGEITLNTNWEVDHYDSNYEDTCSCERHTYYKWNPNVIMFNDGLECLALGRYNIIKILLPKIVDLPASFKKLMVPKSHYNGDHYEGGDRYGGTIKEFQARFPDIIIEYVSEKNDLNEIVNAY